LLAETQCKKSQNDFCNYLGHPGPTVINELRTSACLNCPGTYPVPSSVTATLPGEYNTTFALEGTT
jgi:hypothetical protein